MLLPLLRIAISNSEFVVVVMVRSGRMNLLGELMGQGVNDGLVDSTVYGGSRSVLREDSASID